MRVYNLLKNSLGLTKSNLNSFLEENEITVNDRIVPPSTVLKDNDIVKVNGKELKPIPFYYYLYYKPRGILSTISNRKESYIHHIKLPYKVTPAGRLDKNSEGLMLLSNDGKFLNEFTGDDFIHEKEYYVKLKYPINEEFIEGMGKSYFMDGRWTKEGIVKKLDEYTISIILYEGLYHQIRRLVHMNKNSVLELKRIRVGSYTLDSMKPGDLIEIKPKE